MARKKTKSLDALRRDIDAIDDQLHDLIMKRSRLVEQVRDHKIGDRVKIRPAREAEILYRLLERHKGPFPKRELVRIWRELIVATIGFEGPFSVAVLADEDGRGCWDLARDQYGSFTPMTRHTSARGVIRAVQHQDATVGVLPWPEGDDDDPWWRHLVSETDGTPRIVARLPFAAGGNVRDIDRDALVICPLEQEATGRDRSFLAVETEEPIGFGPIQEALEQTGLTGGFQHVWHEAEHPDTWAYLIEVNGFVEAGGRRMARFLDGLGRRIVRTVHLGGYAIPPSDVDLVAAVGK